AGSGADGSLSGIGDKAPKYTNTQCIIAVSYRSMIRQSARWSRRPPTGQSAFAPEPFRTAPQGPADALETATPRDALATSRPAHPRLAQGETAASPRPYWQASQKPCRRLGSV